jgi:hypothetical protein
VQDLVSLFLVVAVLIAALSFMIRGGRPRTGEGRAGARRPRALRRYRATSVADPAALLVVALGGLAVGTLTGQPSTAAGLGLIVTLTRCMGAQAADTALGLIGAAAALHVAQQVASGPACWTIGTTARWITVGVVTTVFTVAFLVGRHLPGNRRSTSVASAGLGLFAVLEVIAFLISPAGVPIAVSGPGATGVSVLAAGVFGLGSGYAPVLGPLLLGAGVAIAGAGAAVLVGQACPGASATQAIVSAAAFTAVAGAPLLFTRAERA